MKKGYSFKDRVDKVFGSIPSSSSSSAWSITDAPVERREWNRRHNTTDDRDDDQIPVFSSASASAGDNIRSSIGLDSTLDHEEEEDAYDKMAQGTENCSHRCLYMKDVAAPAAAHHGPYLNSHNLLPKPIHHHAAARLKEEDDDHVPMLNAAAAEEASVDNNNNNNNNGGILRIKSILKKRKTYDDEDHHELAKPTTAKQRKRVRFDSTCKNVVDAPHPDPTPLVVVSQNNRPPPAAAAAAAVPDYILNPSNYTRYTFDDGWPCNTTKSTLDFLLESSSKVEHESCGGELPPPKSTVVFIPRKNRGDDNNNNNNEVRKQQQQSSSTQACSSSTIGIATQHQQDEEEEEEEKHDVDDVCPKARPVRQYRSKTDDYDDDVS